MVKKIKVVILMIMMNEYLEYQICQIKNIPQKLKSITKSMMMCLIVVTL